MPLTSAPSVIHHHAAQQSESKYKVPFGKSESLGLLLITKPPFPQGTAALGCPQKKSTTATCSPTSSSISPADFRVNPPSSQRAEGMFLTPLFQA